MTGWAPALRIARRELLRAKGRTALVLAMVLLPVLAVTALSTLLRTSEITVQEGLPRELGSAAARLGVGDGRAEQDPLQQSVAQHEPVERATAADVRRLLPEGSRLLGVRFSQNPIRVQVGDRRHRVGAIGVDLSDPALRGPFDVVSGRAPTGVDEVAVSARLADDGAGLGSVVHVGDEPRTVTGVVEGPRDLPYGPGVLGLPEAVGLADAPVDGWWTTGPPVLWEDVEELNAVGVTVLSRAVVLDPPPRSAYAQSSVSDDSRSVTIAIVGLIAVMAVLEVVLLAGPAFAVGARRQRRSLALMAAGGASPAQVRRVVLAQGLLVGLIAVAVGGALGLALAAAGRAPLTRFAGAEWGPFEVAPLDLLLIALLGAGTALLSALLPAHVVARQPVVAALTGRRVTAAGAARPALVGLLLLAAGVLVTLASLGAPHRFGVYGELGVAVGAVPVVLGAVLTAPAALSLCGRLAGRLPLVLRFAVRDADRQRGRTAPAVAAVTAVVAAAVALGTAGGSDAAQERRDYTPSGPPGVAVVATYEREVDLAEVADVARDVLPGEAVQVVRGVPVPASGPDGHTEVQLCGAGQQEQDGRCFAPVSTGSSLGSDLLVGRGELSAVAERLAPGQLAVAERALDQGRVLLAVNADFPASRPEAGPVQLRVTRFARDPAAGTEKAAVLETVDTQAVPVTFTGQVAPVRAVLPEEVAAQLEVTDVALLVGDDLSRAQEDRLTQAVLAYDEAVSVQVERGFTDDDNDATVLLVLTLVSGVLVLAGTLAATSLALSEARPDLLTLGQVGARPRTPRLVAAGYTLVLGLIGAILGTAAGLVPGVAAAVPLTRGHGGTGAAQDGYVVAVPWTLLAVVLVVVPLLSALVAAAMTRRLPSPGRAVA